MEPLAAPEPRTAGGTGAGRDLARVRSPLSGASLSRAETALRKVTQDWALACNIKQLDDLVELYLPDATVLRPNVPAVRGTAAIREFFFGLLDAGMSEVEMDPLRVELFGDFGYEAGRCKSLVPSAAGKRREERGKYLVLLNRQANGEWKILADSWSSDLSLAGRSGGPAEVRRGPGKLDCGAAAQALGRLTPRPDQTSTSSLRKSRRSCSTSCISMVCMPSCRAPSRFRARSSMKQQSCGGSCVTSRASL